MGAECCSLRPFKAEVVYLVIEPLVTPFRGRQWTKRGRGAYVWGWK